MIECCNWQIREDNSMKAKKEGIDMGNNSNNNKMVSAYCLSLTVFIGEKGYGDCKGKCNFSSLLFSNINFT